jgi:predicted nuclease of predicted toxin-antitoxin system
MIIWVDAHLSPAIATWITTNFNITALALRDVGLRDAEDPEIFAAAKTAEVTVLTKDSDFVDLAG